MALEIFFNKHNDKVLTFLFMIDKNSLFIYYVFNIKCLHQMHWNVCDADVDLVCVGRLPTLVEGASLDAL